MTFGQGKSSQVRHVLTHASQKNTGITELLYFTEYVVVL